MNKNYFIFGSFLVLVLAVTLVSAGLFDSITGNVVKDATRCSADNPCQIGEGDCRGQTNFCVEGAFCNYDIGKKYDYSRRVDVCEAKVLEDENGKKALLIEGDLVFKGRDTPQNERVRISETGYITTADGVPLIISSGYNTQVLGEFALRDLSSNQSGQNAYACINDWGIIYRSQIPCV